MLLNVLVLVNIVSNIFLLICEVQLFLFLPKTLNSLNTSFISLKYLCKILFHTSEAIVCVNTQIMVWSTQLISEFNNCYIYCISHYWIYLIVIC